jgi:antitoxin component YwqK of YwqJK toxin-antitoxin module
LEAKRRGVGNQLQFLGDKEKTFTGVAVGKKGGLKRELGYEDSKKHDLLVAWYENGQKEWETTFQNGGVISTKLWHEDGNLK